MILTIDFSNKTLDNYNNIFDYYDFIYELKSKLDYFNYHNKNLTKKQEEKIDELKELVKCLKIIDK